VTAELFALGMFEFAACFFVAITAIAGGAVISDHVLLGLPAALAISISLVSLAIGSYRGEAFLRGRRIAFKAALSIALALGAGMVIVLLIKHPGASADDSQRHALLGAAALCLVVLITVRMAFGYAYRLGVFSRRLALIGPAAETAVIAEAIDGQTNKTFEIISQFNTDALDTDLLRQCKQRHIWGVVLASPLGADALAAWRSAADAFGVQVLASADLWERYLKRLKLDSLTDQISTRSRSHGISAVLHRLADITLSLGLLTFTLPLMVVTAIAIRLESPGAVLYTQERVGLHGVPFTVYKFRSMRPDAEAGGPVWASTRDNRVTRVGQFIRLTRIDELPQLLNILQGKMSFIGPRPERPHFVEQLIEVVPFYADRAQVKPGLTGWAQVNYPYGASVEDARMKLSYDLYYVKHQNIFLDIMILFATIRVILFQEGAR